MKKVMMMVLAMAISSGAAGALELEKINANDISKMAQEARTAIPEPQLARVTRTAAPITVPVDFKSPAFAELLINSLNVKPQLVSMAGGQSYVYKVGEGLTCYKSVPAGVNPASAAKARYSCAINPAGGWKFMGMESYGSGDNRAFTLALYSALKVKETNDEGMLSKSLQLDRPDSDGGTERNLLHCLNMGAEGEAMGFRPSCQLINAL